MTDLDELFAASARSGPEPSQALMARVMADALAIQSGAQPAVAAAGAAPPAALLPAAPGLLAQLLGLFGGAGALAGVVTAGFAGLAAGYLQPASLSTLAGYLSTSTTASSTEAVELMPGLDALLTEE